MRRRLFTFFSALSLLLFVATCALWLRSYWVGEMVWWGRAPGRKVGLLSSMGQCAVYYDPPTSADVEPPQWHYSNAGSWAGLKRRAAWYLADPGVRSHGPAFGFALFRRRGTGPFASAPNAWEAFFPHGLVVVATSILPAGWLYSRIRRRSRAVGAGLCPACGYDLRATPERCPECGTAVTSETGVA